MPLNNFTLLENFLSGAAEPKLALFSGRPGLPSNSGRFGDPRLAAGRPTGLDFAGLLMPQPSAKTKAEGGLLNTAASSLFEYQNPAAGQPAGLDFAGLLMPQPSAKTKAEGGLLNTAASSLFEYQNPSAPTSGPDYGMESTLETGKEVWALKDGWPAGMAENGLADRELAAHPCNWPSVDLEPVNELATSPAWLAESKTVPEADDARRPEGAFGLPERRDPGSVYVPVVPSANEFNTALAARPAVGPGEAGTRYFNLAFPPAAGLGMSLEMASANDSQYQSNDPLSRPGGAQIFGDRDEIINNSRPGVRTEGQAFWPNQVGLAGTTLGRPKDFVWPGVVEPGVGFEPPAAPKPSTSAPTLAPSAGGDEESYFNDGRVSSWLNQGPGGSEPSWPIETEAAGLLKKAVPEEIFVLQPRLTASLSQGLGHHPGRGDWPDLANGLLARQGLTPAVGVSGSGVWGRGEGEAPVEVIAALDKARLAWPAPFRRRVGLGLVALGRPGMSANSMAAGAALLGSATPGEMLREVLGSLKGELKTLKLPPEARDGLGRLLADSGLDQEHLDKIMAGFGRDGLPLAELAKKMAGLDMSRQARGLKATEAGLMELGQFLGSLGASAEAIDQVMTGLSIGQPVTGEALRDLLSGVEVGGLSRTLGPGDLQSLVGFLQKMGGAPADMKRLQSLLGETSGQLTLGGFLDFLDSLKEAPLTAVSGQGLEELRALLDLVRREDKLAKTPVFNETLIKLQALGDAEIDEDFLNLSPALQVLRGGLSGAQDWTGQQFSGQDRGRENQERYRQLLQAAAMGQSAPAGTVALAAAEAAAGYGARPESLPRQIAQKIIFSRRRGLYRLKMNLNPVELGRLEIELAVRNGALTARIKAENRSAYEALGDQAPELKRALAEGGVELAELTLTHDEAESGLTFTAGLAELTAETHQALREGRVAPRPGEVHRIV